MFKKGTKLYGIVKGKCPRCNEGDFFKYGFTINPAKITQLHQRCSKCDLKYMIEPSFFFGAMYITYGITVAIAIAIFLLTKVILGLSLVQSFISVFTVLLVLAPFNLRLARVIWIHMFVSFDKNAISKKNG